MTTEEMRVEISSDKGRSGHIIFSEGIHFLQFEYELCGPGDTVATIPVPSESSWDSQIPWAAERRSSVLSFIASEVIRQKSPSSSFNLGDRFIWILA